MDGLGKSIEPQLLLRTEIGSPEEGTPGALGTPLTSVGEKLGMGGAAELSRVFGWPNALPGVSPQSQLPWLGALTAALFPRTAWEWVVGLCSCGDVGIAALLSFAANAFGRAPPNPGR